MKTYPSTHATNTLSGKRFLLIVTGVLALTALALLCSCTTSAPKSNIAVTLDSNAGTGYLWTSEISPQDAFEEVSHDTKPLDDRAGGKLQDVFTLKALKSGEATLTFTLARPWEDAGGEDAQVVQFVVKVDDNKNITIENTQSDIDVATPVLS